MHRYLTILLMLCVVNTKSQENYEIQVYGSATQPKHSTIFELHSNFTFHGEKQIVDGVRPSQHSLHETIEITHGVAKNFELGFYVFMNYTSSYGFQFIGTHIRPRVMAPTDWHLPVGLSLSAEIGYQRPQYATDTWSIELRPIIDKTWGRFYWSLNPTMEIQLKGVEKQSAPTFAPNIKLQFSVSQRAGAGFEYYGDLGALNNFESGNRQEHALFFVYDLLNNTKWELNAGVGIGLTNATDALLAKVLVGRRIKWK